MEMNNVSRGYSHFDQLKKYARDLSEVYQSEKEKRRALQAANQQLVKYADDLSQITLELRTAHQELQKASLDTIRRLVIAAEYKDEDTGDHIIRMSGYSALIAERCGLPAKEVQNILYAAPMHDVGKIGIPDSILMKPGKLTVEEFEIVKTHTTIGANILAYSRAEVLNLAEQVALCHHEKWDGKGYPQGLAGNTTPLAARIIGLADVFDALTSKRPNKDAYPVDMACDIIKREREHQFDPDIVDVFLKHLDEILKIKAETGSGLDVFSVPLLWGEGEREEEALPPITVSRGRKT